MQRLGRPAPGHPRGPGLDGVPSVGHEALACTACRLGGVIPVAPVAPLAGHTPGRPACAGRSRNVRWRRVPDSSTWWLARLSRTQAATVSSKVQWADKWTLRKDHEPCASNVSVRASREEA